MFYFFPARPVHKVLYDPMFNLARELMWSNKGTTFKCIYFEDSKGKLTRCIIWASISAQRKEKISQAANIQVVPVASGSGSSGGSPQELKFWSKDPNLSSSKLAWV